jgi:prepilin-type processing-associated H-X9-DG protein
MPRITIEDLRVEAELTRSEQQEILGGLLPYIEQDNLFKRYGLHNDEYSPADTTSSHTGGANFVFGDGSVRSISH